MRPIDPTNPTETPSERHQREIAAEVQRKAAEKADAEDAAIDAAAAKRADELRAERDAVAAAADRQTAVAALAAKKLELADAAATTPPVDAPKA